MSSDLPNRVTTLRQADVAIGQKVGRFGFEELMTLIRCLELPMEEAQERRTSSPNSHIYFLLKTVTTV